MAEECVVAVYAGTAPAKLAIDKLVAEGFPATNISLVTGTMKNEPAAVKRALELGDESEKDAAIGAGIGSVIGLLGGASIISMAGAGVVIAGPLGAATGAVVGGILGAIRGWSVHTDHIPKYEEMVKSGKVLVIAHSDDPRAIAKAETTLRTTQPSQLKLYVKVDDGDDPKVDDT